MAEIAAMTALVVSAHAADFVWRAGGAIALYAKRGCAVTIVCLSYGERGESGKLWRKEGATLEEVKEARKVEAENAANILGAAALEFLAARTILIAAQTPANRALPTRRAIQAPIERPHPWPVIQPRNLPRRSTRILRVARLDQLPRRGQVIDQIAGDHRDLSQLR